MKYFALFVLYLLLSQLVSGQEYNWFKQFGGTGDDRVAVVQMDSNGDLIIAGTFSNTVDFDPSLNTEERTSNGWWDAFVAKYDTTGALIWVRTFGSTDFDYAQALMIDSDDNIYVSGNYGGSMDIDPGPDLETISPIGGICSYLLKLTTDGEYAWSRNLTGYDVRITSIKQGVQGIVCGGYFTQTCEFNNEGSSFSMTSDGTQDVFVLTLTIEGVFINAKQLGNSGQNILRGFDLDANGNIYLSCEFEGSIDVDPGSESTLLTVTNPSNYGNFIGKYDSDFELIWAKMPEFPSYAQFRNIIVHTEDEIIFNGYFKDSIRFDQFNDLSWHFSAGDDDQFIGKMNSNGEMQWLRFFGNEEEDDGGKLHISEDGIIYMYDYFSGTIDTDPGTEINEASSIGSNDNYILKMSPDGEKLWFLQDSTDFPNAYYMSALISGSQNDLYALYSFYNAMGVVENGTLYSFLSNGDFDILLIQLKSDNMLNIAEGQLSIVIYPNPASDLIKIEGLNGKEVVYSIMNSDGQEVSNGTTNCEIILINLAPGLYFLKLGEITVRFIKM